MWKMVRRRTDLTSNLDETDVWLFPQNCCIKWQRCLCTYSALLHKYLCEKQIKVVQPLQDEFLKNNRENSTLNYLLHFGMTTKRKTQRIFFAIFWGQEAILVEILTPCSGINLRKSNNRNLLKLYIVDN